MIDKKYLDHLEELADQFLRKGRHLLPTLARLFLLCTFIEDGFRMWVQWTEQSEYIQSTWNCSAFLGYVFVVINMLGQLVASGMVLFRFKVPIACVLLCANVLLQTIAYNIVFEIHFLLRNAALFGGILLLYVDSQAQGKSIFAGVPTMGEEGSKQWIQLSGRILLVLMFLTLAKFDSLFHIVNFIFDLCLVLCIAVGFKTKLCALGISAKLFVMNFISNPWWYYPSTSPARDFLKYDFFQSMSVIGGLLIIVAIGPGGVSLDEHKKRW